jgi:nitroreductase
LNFAQPLSDLITARTSTRVYQNRPIPPDVLDRLQQAAACLPAAPFGSSTRFEILAAVDDTRTELRGLGTYGGIQNAMAFIVGAVQSGPRDLEDYAYRLEHLVLLAADLGLGSCWLGGSFTRSSFSRRIHPREDESLPAVISLGIPQSPAIPPSGALLPDDPSIRRLPWNSLFFDGDWSHPFTPATDPEFAPVLEMVRRAPSAKNYQPWRWLRTTDSNWHLFIQRTPGYRHGLLATLLAVEDLQRLDMGIAMAHFDLAVASIHRAGAWNILPDDDRPAGPGMEYIGSWQPIHA